MKLVSIYFILIFFSLSQNLFSQVYTVGSVPNPRSGYGGFISDPSKYIGEAEFTSLNEELVQLEKNTSAEFAIVILPSIGEFVVKDFAVELFNTWGIGKKGQDNGILLLIVMDQRRWEFEIGYGLEGVLPDATLKRIGEETLVPKLRQQKMGEGLLNVTSEISRRINHQPEDNTRSEIESLQKNEIDSEEKFDSSIYSFQYHVWYFFLAPLYAGFLYLIVNYLKGREGKKSSLLFSQSLINWKIVLIGLSPYVVYNAYLLVMRDVYLPPVLLVNYLYLASIIILYLVHYFYQVSQKQYKDPYELYQLIDSKLRSGELITVMILFPLPLLILLLWGLLQKRKLRRVVRVCQKCNTDMILLDEQKDDFFLKDGQKIEEKIGSIDYDVWYCEKSKDVKIYAYEAFFTSYSKCPSCRFKTYFLQSDSVTVSPTCTSSGSGIRRYACKNCSYKTSSTYTIPARDCSKSSSSSSSSYRSSSSSSSSSSFGGGRSGGGGAGGSW